MNEKHGSFFFYLIILKPEILGYKWDNLGCLEIFLKVFYLARNLQLYKGKRK